MAVRRKVVVCVCGGRGAKSTSQLFSPFESAFQKVLPNNFYLYLFGQDLNYGYSYCTGRCSLFGEHLTTLKKNQEKYSLDEKITVFITWRGHHRAQLSLQLGSVILRMESLLSFPGDTQFLFVLLSY